MTIKDALRHATIAPADAELLLGCALGKPRTWILAHSEYALTNTEEEKYTQYQKRRMVNEPVAYITGEKEFYGRVFTVTSDVLIPRPATEVLLTQSLEILRGGTGGIIPADAGIVAWSEILRPDVKPELILDGGTGSGCIAVTLACEMPEVRIIAVDTSEEALNIARKNAQHHGVFDRIEFRNENMIDSIKEISVPFFLVSNPPYIPSDQTLMPDVSDFEPHQALFAGKDGTDTLQSLIHEARENPFCYGFAVECKEEQTQHLN